MSFEISDQEAKEVHFTIGKKLTGIKSMIAKAEKGTPIHGKEKLVYREPIMQELIDRLREHYPKIEEKPYPILEE